MNDISHKQLSSPIILVILMIGTFVIVLFATKTISEVNQIYASSQVTQESGQ